MTVAATAAVALVLAGGGVLTVAGFAQRERSSLDRELERRAEGPAGRIAALPPPGAGRAERPLLAESGFFARVIENGEVVAEAGDVPASGFPLPERSGFETVTSDGRDWRTLAIRPPLPPRPFGGAQAGPREIQFAADLGPVEDRISEMRTRVGVISAAGILLAAGLAWLFAGLALGPLSRLRASVAGVSTTRDLSRRLPESGAPQEVGELTRSVNAMLARLEQSAAETERALDATRRFAGDVGHELRTPLTSIRANFDALRRNPAMRAEERRAILEQLSAEQARLVTLLDALQALARGDAAAALPREELDFAELVGAAVDAARRRHPGASISLEAQPFAAPLCGWPDGLRLLVDNLLENAVRHGGSRVRVKLGEADGLVSLAVEDDGPGVPGDERERIFERFARGAATEAPGSGLGLALVAQQAKLHGGAVEVGDSGLGGAQFSVRLPAAGTAGGSEARAEGARRDSGIRQ